jgi:hypothetical protein
MMMATSLHSRYRWILTGTPTTTTASLYAILFRQFRFLRHPLFDEDAVDAHSLWKKLYVPALPLKTSKINRSR